MRLFRSIVDGVREVNRKYAKPEIDTTLFVKICLLSLRIYLLVMIGLMAYALVDKVVAGGKGEHEGSPAAATEPSSKPATEPAGEAAAGPASQPATGPAAEHTTLPATGPEAQPATQPASRPSQTVGYRLQTCRIVGQVCPTY